MRQLYLKLLLWAAAALMITPAIAQLDNSMCWKDTKTRGAGVVPSGCTPDQSYEAGLCYPKCREGYKGFATMCIQKDCPAGFHDDGAF